MPQRIQCPACGSRFRIADRHLGKKIVCPTEDCSQKIRVAAPEGQSGSDRPEDSNAAKPSVTDQRRENRVPSGRRRRTQGPKRQEAAFASKAWGIAGVIGLVGLFVGYGVLSDRSQRELAASEIAAADSAGAAGTSSAHSLTEVPQGNDPAHWRADRESRQDSPRNLSETSKGGESGALAASTAAQPSGDVQGRTSVPALIPVAAPIDDTRERQRKLKEELLPFLNKYCSDCHGEYEQEGGIGVHKLTELDQFLTERKTWDKVYRMLQTGAMPPQDYDPLPPREERERLAEYMRTELYEFDCSDIHDPGRPTVRRLNRAEYNNTVSDLFGMPLTPAADFPADDVGEGFDNIGDVLTISPLLMEKYLNAAEQVVDQVIDTTDYSKRTEISLSGDRLRTTSGGSEANGFRILATNGEVFSDVEVPVTGEYKVTAVVAADQAGDERAEGALQIDENAVHRFTVREHRRPQTVRHILSLKQGKARVGVAFLNDYYNPEAEDGRRDRNLGVRSIVLEGPLKGGTRKFSEAHRRLIIASPADGLTPEEAAHRILSAFLPRAFRRPVADREIQRYAALASSSMETLEVSFEQAVSLTIQAVLVSPEFLFRPEGDPDSNQDVYVLNDHELAVRLSYFLWSTMPDDELFRLAGEGRLRDDNVLKQQISRMLRDERSRGLVDNFAAQWLNLRNLTEVSPNPDVYPDFDEPLRSAMRRETELLFETIVREDRSVDDFLAADFTFVNERLARHYGLGGINGEEFIRVSLEGQQRAGVLTHASILTLTSNPGRTSPVKRGKWIMENLFGEAPPPAPPGVPELEETAKSAPDATLREQLAKHREDPGCASCHDAMDPLGLGLENFDGVGQWREEADGHPVDASGILPDGREFRGPLELVEIVRSRRQEFSRSLAEKLMTYALGRGLEYYDKCTVDRALEQFEANNRRISALVEGIVLSEAFRTRRGSPEPLQASR